MSQSIANAYSYGGFMPQYVSKPKNPNSILDSAKRMAGIDIASYIFPDTKALYDLNLSSYIDLSYNEITIVGYEVYLVEQWIAQRKISSLITSFTGNTQDSIKAIQVILPRDPKLWPGKFKQYHEELMEYAQPKRMNNNSCLFITNLSSLPSSLNILHIESGDMRTIWSNFKINFDLKMLNCAGRSALLLSYPAKSSVEKFLQLYKFQRNTRSDSDNIQSSSPSSSTRSENNYQSNLPQSKSVLTTQYNEAIAVTQECYEVVYMVELIQICLSYFNIYLGKIDGLVCKTTDRSVEQWWEQYGKIYLGIEKPKNEPILGPTSVASILSLVLSCYFKLILEDCISSNDPFDRDEFFSAIMLFQKKYGLLIPSAKKYVLDNKTIEKLFDATAKYSLHDIMKFKKFVKSTVQNLSGKGNPITLSHEILTSDLDTLVSNFHGGSLGLLWKGKGRSKAILTFDKEMSDFCNFKFIRGNPNEQLNIQEENKRKKEEIEQQNKLKKKKRQFNINDFVESRELPDDLDEDDMESSTTSDSEFSVSSMFCNYDESRYLGNLDSNRLYFDEYNRRNSFPAINDSVEENILQDLQRPIDKAHKLYRSNSFSKVCDTIDRWNLPFDASVLKIARDLKKIETNLNIEKKIGAMEEDDFPPGSIEFDNIQAEKDFERIRKQLRLNHDKYTNESIKFERKANVLDNKQRLLNTEIIEINSLTSKLKYDVRLLEVRMRDVEDSVKQFNSKLDNVKKSLIAQNCNVAHALDCVSDKTQFNNCLNSLMDSQRLCYKGFCVKIIDVSLFRQLKKDITGWINYLFSNFSSHSNDYKNVQTKNPTTDFPI